MLHYENSSTKGKEISNWTVHVRAGSSYLYRVYAEGTKDKNVTFSLLHAVSCATITSGELQHYYSLFVLKRQSRSKTAIEMMPGSLCRNGPNLHLFDTSSKVESIIFVVPAK